jgi:hypothetical protein
MLSLPKHEGGLNPIACNMRERAPGGLGWSTRVLDFCHEPE